MTRRLLIAGSGFAGLWAGLSARRAASLVDQADGADRADDVEVTLVSPSPTLTIRPRLYEAALDDLAPDLTALLQATGIDHLPGRLVTVDTAGRRAEVVTTDGERRWLAWDRFIAATGSQVFLPPLPGLAEHGFSVDTLEAARTLDDHLAALSKQPSTQSRDTVVVVGGGLTGLETATEMPGRLRARLGDAAPVRVVIVDSAAEIGATLGEAPLPPIREALAHCGVEPCPGVRVTAVDAEGVTLSNGERLEALTVVWTAGLRAHPLAGQIPGEHDELGRVIGDGFLRAPSAEGVFVTGDLVKVPTDDQGHYNVMSCQHAMSLGRVAGHNAMAELLGLPLHRYRQPKYVTCVDLGRWGALFTEGWERKVLVTGADGRKIKREINTQWIYPPAPDRAAVFAIANPDYVIVP